MRRLDPPYLARTARDARACAWCGKRQTALVWGGYVCPYGCAEAKHAPFLGHCQDCHGEYLTGNPDRRDQCEACFSREFWAAVAAFNDGAELGATGYEHDMRMKGANRYAVDAVPAEEREASMRATLEAIRK